ncbi:MAG TPA: 2'-5' RNA ligase family protein [Dongiaceae bacterium]|nr:2'-5' RNA ligase family protein [Dongiaceae bacterium]
MFFAIFPDPEAAARIAQLAQRLHNAHGLKGTPLAARRFHVSLHHVADHLPPNVVATASEAVARIAMPPFRIELDHAKSLGRNGHSRPFVLCGGDGVAGLVRFQHMLAVAMEGAGLGRWIGPSWLPHLTLLYGDREITDEAIEPVGWVAREFVLVHSLLGRNRYVPLARWPLSG